MAFHSGEDIGCIVGDIGSFSAKIGYAGDDSPRVWFPTAVAQVDPSFVKDRVASDGEQKQTLVKDKQFEIGNDMLQLPPTKCSALVSPIEDGLVANWDALEETWHYAAAKLSTDLKDHPVMLTEAPWNTHDLRSRYTEMMFENFSVPAVFMSKTAVLSCYANARTSGLVVDCGHAGTSAVPVLDGYCQYHQIQRTPLAGAALDEYYLRSLSLRGLKVKPRYSIKRKRDARGVMKMGDLSPSELGPDGYYRFHQLQEARELRETLFRVMEDPFDTNSSMNMLSQPYELPDGTTLDVGSERYSVGELLFNPATATTKKVEWKGMRQLVDDCISSSNADHRKELYQNLILCGGTSLTVGFCDRLNREMEGASYGYKVRVLNTGVAERKISAWLGGSILGSLGSFHEMYMSRQEYDEYGANLVQKKCP